MNDFTKHLCRAPAYSQDPELIWRCLYQSLVPYVWYWIHSSNVPSWQGQEDDIVDDIIQEVVVRIFRYIHAVKHKEDLRGASFERVSLLIARRYCNDLQKQDTPLVHFSLMDSWQHNEIIYDEDMNPQEDASKKISQEYLFHTFAKATMMLPTQVRHIILVDLANRTDVEEYSIALRQAFGSIGVPVENYQRSLPEYIPSTKLLCLIYERVKEQMTKSSELDNVPLKEKWEEIAITEHEFLDSIRVYSEYSQEKCDNLQKEKDRYDGIPFAAMPTSASLFVGDMDDTIQNDPELLEIASHLQNTAAFAVRPAFKEELRKKLLGMLVEKKAIEYIGDTPEEKLVSGLNDMLLSRLPSITPEIAKLPEGERNALLTDLANRLPNTDKRDPLEHAFLKEGIYLQSYGSRRMYDSLENKKLLSRAYDRIVKFLRRCYGKSTDRIMPLLI